MVALARFVVEIALYAAFMAALVIFSSAPAYQHLDPEAVLVKMSFSHAAARLKPCRRLDADELAALPPNMRQPTACERARVNLSVNLELDGEVLYAASVPPSGLASDGEATIYEKFVIDPGRHSFTVSMRDTVRESGSDYTATYDAELEPGQLLVIDFDDVSGGFSFR